jgi:hypothetical protein
VIKIYREEGNKYLSEEDMYTIPMKEMSKQWAI